MLALSKQKKTLFFRNKTTNENFLKVVALLDRILQQRDFDKKMFLFLSSFQGRKNQLKNLIQKYW